MDDTEYPAPVPKPRYNVEVMASLEAEHRLDSAACTLGAIVERLHYTHPDQAREGFMLRAEKIKAREALVRAVYDYNLTRP